MRGRGDDMGMGEGRRMLAARNQARKMRHINHERRANFIGNRTKLGKIDDPRIGGTACDYQGWAVFLGQCGHLVIINQMIVRAHAILDGIEPFS